MRKSEICGHHDAGIAYAHLSFIKKRIIKSGLKLPRLSSRGEGFK
jgi:hypothetical protein